MTTAHETYSVQPGDDLGAMPVEMARAGLSHDEVMAWLDAHEDAGTFEILRDSDGQPECGYVFGLCGGAWACECGRPECPDALPRDTEPEPETVPRGTILPSAPNSVSRALDMYSLLKLSLDARDAAGAAMCRERIARIGLGARAATLGAV